jgi:hypothetical protein
MHLRLIVPAEQSRAVLGALEADPRVTNLVRLAGAAVRPPGDLVLCDVIGAPTADRLHLAAGPVVGGGGGDRRLRGGAVADGRSRQRPGGRVHLGHHRAGRR